MVVRKRGILVSAGAQETELRVIQGVGFGRVADRIPAKQAIGRRKNLVHSSLPIVVSGRLGEGKCEFVTGKIRERKQVQYGLYRRGDISSPDAGVVGRYMASRLDRARHRRHS